VRRNVAVLSEVAREAGLGLCLKHYPGLGGATSDTHEELTEITGTVTEEQLRLFTELWASIPGGAILLSHGMMRHWDNESPVSVSSAAVGALRAAAQSALLITDDLQMRGLQAVYGTIEAAMRGVRAGVDLVCMANNEREREAECFGAAREISRSAAADPELRRRIEQATGRTRARKTHLAFVAKLSSPPSSGKR
jgi:beta-N-acetylhexosaminidase